LLRPVAKSTARSIWCKISRSAVSTVLEGIDGVCGRSRTDVGFEAVTVHDIDGTIEQAGDVLLEACIVVYGKRRFRIDLD
jgi:hypothetical protein